MLEAATTDDDDTDEEVDTDWAIELVCRILADGLQAAGVGSTAVR
jgi:hypothetical protein